MSDEKLRELERRWKETGSVEHEAKYLLERVRVGDLEQEKLELAAYCGHEGARLGFLADANKRTSPLESAAFAKGLAPWGKFPCVLAVATAAAHVRPLLTSADAQRRFGALLTVAIGWLSDPRESSATSEQVRDWLQQERRQARDSDGELLFVALLAAESASMPASSRGECLVAANLTHAQALALRDDLVATGAEARIEQAGTDKPSSSLHLVAPPEREIPTIAAVARIQQTSLAEATKRVRQLRLGTYDYLAAEGVRVAEEALRAAGRTTAALRNAIETAIARWALLGQFDPQALSSKGLGQ